MTLEEFVVRRGGALPGRPDAGPPKKLLALQGSMLGQPTQRCSYAAAGWWQAARCPAAELPIRTRGGSSAAHCASALGHRVRNRQPEGGLSGLGTSPTSRI